MTSHCNFNDLVQPGSKLWIDVKDNFKRRWVNTCAWIDTEGCISPGPLCGKRLSLYRWCAAVTESHIAQLYSLAARSGQAMLEQALRTAILKKSKQLVPLPCTFGELGCTLTTRRCTWRGCAWVCIYSLHFNRVVVWPPYKSAFLDYSAWNNSAPDWRDLQSSIRWTWETPPRRCPLDLRRWGAS